MIERKPYRIFSLQELGEIRVTKVAQKYQVSTHFVYRVAYGKTKMTTQKQHDIHQELSKRIDACLY